MSTYNLYKWCVEHEFELVLADIHAFLVATMQYGDDWNKECDAIEGFFGEMEKVRVEDDD